MAKTDCPVCGNTNTTIYSSDIEHDRDKNTVTFIYEYCCDHCEADFNVNDSYNLVFIESVTELDY